MKKLPAQEDQVVIIHAAFIRQVVELSQNPARREELEALLGIAIDNGWSTLVKAVRRILSGQREPSVLAGLDWEDRTIAEAIMRGMQNPATLPDPTARPAPEMAAPGLADMILAARRGNSQALRLISEMAEQMQRVGGPMARLAGVIRPLINGERDPHLLCRGMDEKTEQMVMAILKELKRSELN